MQGEEFIDDDLEPDPDLNQITNSIIGAAIAVHKAIGPGHLESAYEEAVAIEFEYRGIPFDRQVPVELTYRERPVGHGRLGFLVEKRVVVALKAVESISATHRTQMISYLKITKLRLGLIINFNVPVRIQGIRRFAN